MSYSEFRQSADSAPLANALTKIAAITDRSESDVEQMIEMLNEIEDTVQAAREAWLTNVRAAQEAELQRLRAAAKA